MIENIYTQHAVIRMQQRSIPPIIEEWLDRYGEEEYTGNGAMLRYFSKRSMRKMQSELGQNFVEQIKKYLRVYKVESAEDGKIITVGWRNQRIIKS